MDTYFLNKIFPFFGGNRIVSGSNSIRLIVGEGESIILSEPLAVDWNQATSVAIEDENTIWVGTIDRGLFRVSTLDPTAEDLQYIDIDRWNQFGSSPDKVSWAHVVTLDGQLYVISNEGIFSYNDDKNVFYHRDNLGDDLGQDGYRIVTYKEGESALWVLFPDGDEGHYRLKRLEKFGRKLREKEYLVPNLRLFDIPTDLVVNVSEGKVMISGKDVLLAKYFEDPMRAASPVISSVKSDSEIITKGIQEPFSQINFSLSSPEGIFGNIDYRWRLSGSSWSNFADVPVIEIKEISNGDILEFQARNSNGSISYPIQYSAKIVPASVPFWRSPIMITQYVIFAGVIVFALMNIYRQPIIKKLKAERIQHANEVARLESKVVESEKTSTVAQKAGTANLRVAVHGYKNLVFSGLNHIKAASKDKNISLQAQASLAALKLIFRKIDVNFQGAFQLDDLEAGTIDLEPEIFDLIPFSSRMLECFRAQVLENKIDYTWDFEGFENVEVTGLYGDQAMLERIMFNLIANALKHSTEGHASAVVRVVPKTHVRADGIIELQIAVEDNGIGVPEGYEEKIFQKFYRLAKGGSGIGLYVSRLMAESMGGKLRYVQNENQGAVFVLTIPFAPPDQMTVNENRTNI
ncbi:MAG: ATP-binding protein [Verrucomicrobiota bacterium]